MCIYVMCKIYRVVRCFIGSHVCFYIMEKKVASTSPHFTRFQIVTYISEPKLLSIFHLLWVVRELKCSILFPATPSLQLDVAKQLQLTKPLFPFICSVEICGWHKS